MTCFRNSAGFLVMVCLFCCCSMTHQNITYHETSKDSDSLVIQEGIVSKEAQRIRYILKGRLEAVIELSQPVMVAMADQKEEWGFFQFPSIGVADDGTLVVTWQMKEDSPATYGKQSNRDNTPMMSKDGGKTWQPQDKKYIVRRTGNYVRLSNGAVLQAITPASLNVRTLKKAPRLVGRNNNYSFYVAEELPEELQGAYISFQGDGKSELIHSKVYDPGLLRSSNNDLLSVFWKGNIKQLSNGSLVAGVYPTYYRDSLGQVLPSGVSFYQSFDSGCSWEVIGKIPFVHDGIAESVGGSGFYEPTFEILTDSTFLCVMRTGASSPMYKTFSYDRGHTWTKPEPFTPNGVKPCLLKLGNGIIVLASGRPGVQLRFSLDGSGQTWTEPIDMVPFMNADGGYTRDVSCGYVSMIDASDDSFYIVYSDFTTKDKSGNMRKSIWFRKIQINFI